MTIDDTTRKAVLKLLTKGLVTQSEAAKLAGISRQLVRHWAKGLPAYTRQKHLEQIWEKYAKQRKN